MKCQLFPNYKEAVEHFMVESTLYDSYREEILKLIQTYSHHRLCYYATRVSSVEVQTAHQLGITDNTTWKQMTLMKEYIIHICRKRQGSLI